MITDCLSGAPREGWGQRPLSGHVFYITNREDWTFKAFLGLIQICSHLAEAAPVTQLKVCWLFLGGCLFSSRPDWGDIFHSELFITAVTLTSRVHLQLFLPSFLVLSPFPPSSLSLPFFCPRSSASPVALSEFDGMFLLLPPRCVNPATNIIQQFVWRFFVEIQHVVWDLTHGSHD